jgi:hypothetical protein
MNYDGEQKYREMQVPREALGKDYELKFSMQDDNTLEQKNISIWIHIRSSHNDIIALPADHNLKR